MSNVTKNNTGLFDIFESVSNWSGGTLGIVLLFLIFIITYVWLSQNPRQANAAFLTASIVTFVSATLFRVLTFTNTWTVYICLIILGLATWNYFAKTD